MKKSKKIIKPNEIIDVPMENIEVWDANAKPKIKEKQIGTIDNTNNNKIKKVASKHFSSDKLKGVLNTKTAKVVGTISAGVIILSFFLPFGQYTLLAIPGGFAIHEFQRGRKGK